MTQFRCTPFKQMEDRLKSRWLWMGCRYTLVIWESSNRKELLKRVIKKGRMTQRLRLGLISSGAFIKQIRRARASKIRKAHATLHLLIRPLRVTLYTQIGLHHHKRGSQPSLLHLPSQNKEGIEPTKGMGSLRIFIILMNKTWGQWGWARAVSLGQGIHHSHLRNKKDSNSNKHSWRKAQGEICRHSLE